MDIVAGNKSQIPISTQALSKQTISNLSNLDWAKFFHPQRGVESNPIYTQTQQQNNTQPTIKNKPNTINAIASQGIGTATDYLSEKVSNNIFGNDTEIGRNMGTLFSSGVSSAGNNISNNLLKGNSLIDGLGKDVGSSVAGAGAGIAANYIGQGINSLGGDSRLSRGIGQGVATGLGTIGGVAASNLVKYGTIAGKAADGASKASLFGKGAGSINPYGLAATVVGSGLGAATGPSKEYSGKKGNITQTMDLAYDAATIAVNAIPGWGQLASGLMTLNKGLSNVFGSTSGMTTQDAILGSAFISAMFFIT